MITKYGYDVFFSVAALCTALVVIGIVFVEPRLLKYSIVGIGVVFFGLTLNFFRDPDRVTPSGDRHIMAPADGKVVALKRVEVSEYLGAPAVQISIFMSPLNVHVNRNPITGVVRHKRYVPGEFLAAFEDKASEKNEQTIIGVENSHGKVLFKQIAGFVSRRILCPLAVGEDVKAGERFGMIKFGSRVDVFVPEDAEILVTPGNVTVAGETVLADFRK
jgi:phosphatidylserine decarboxylase